MLLFLRDGRPHESLIFTIILHGYSFLYTTSSLGGGNWMIIKKSTGLQIIAKDDWKGGDIIQKLYKENLLEAN